MAQEIAGKHGNRIWLVEAESEYKYLENETFVFDTRRHSWVHEAGDMKLPGKSLIMSCELEDYGEWEELVDPSVEPVKRIMDKYRLDEASAWGTMDELVKLCELSFSRWMRDPDRITAFLLRYDRRIALDGDLDVPSLTLAIRAYDQAIEQSLYELNN